MIVECAHCGRRYDAGSLPGDSVVRCACGDLLPLPDPASWDDPALVSRHVARWAEAHGATADALALDGGWEFISGSAVVRIAHDLAASRLHVQAYVMPAPEAPERRLALFARLLELNYRATGEARFALAGGEVLAVFSRPTQGLDFAEFERAVEEVAQTADDLDEPLINEFGYGVARDVEGE